MRWKFHAFLAVLSVIALTVVGVVLGKAISGTVGALTGAVAGALAGVVAAFVPTIREAAERRRGKQADIEREAAAAQGAWRAVGQVADEVAHDGPASLLRPDRGVVEFSGRFGERAALLDWFTSSRERSVRVIIGGGGVGKTRLALRLAEEWEARGWDWRLVAAQREANAVAAARRVTSGPILLVVDYAETRTELESLLRAVLDDRGRIRLLLLARSLGEWWDRLVERSEAAVGRLLNEAPPVLLDKPIIEDVSDAELVASALPYFARALNMMVPEQVQFELPTGRVPVLVLHATALVAVLRFASNPIASLRVVVAEGALDELLDHEARYWRRTAAANELPEDGTLLKSVVAVAVLLGAGSLAETADLITRVPELADAPLGQRRKWARWLYALYPAGNDGQLGSLQPDLVAEKYVVSQLTADHELARMCLKNLSAHDAEHALTVLARASVHQDEAISIMVTALHGDLPRLAMAAVKVALATRSKLGDLLAAAIRDVPITLDQLIRIYCAVPFPSVSLAEARLAMARRVRESLPPDTNLVSMARWSQRLGGNLALLGHWAEALPFAEEAVAILRELAEVHPGRHLYKLTLALCNVSIFLSELGRQVEALPVAEEAVIICRQLVRTNPNRDLYRSDLAGQLDNLSVRLSKLGRPAEALPPMEESVVIYRRLVETGPNGERYRPDLAHSLADLGVRFSQLGRPAEALPVTAEAVTIYRELSEINPDRYRPDLARVLINLSVRFSDLGRLVEELSVIEEAVAIYRELEKSRPGPYRIGLAMALNNLGYLLVELDRPDDSLPVIEEAVAIRRELAEASPSTYRPGLARSLDNLGVAFLKLGRHADGLPVSEEAVAINRTLAKATPVIYSEDLALSLNNLSKLLSALGRPAEAFPFVEEAVAIYRDLAEINPDRHVSGLATSLDTLSITLCQIGRTVDALAAEQEAVAKFRKLLASSPERYRRDLAQSLTNLAEVFSALERYHDADVSRREAAKILNSLEP